MTGAVIANAGRHQERLRRQRDGSLLPYQPNDMAGDTMLFGRRLCGSPNVACQPMLTGIVDDRRTEICVVPVIRMHQRPEHRRGKRRHERGGDTGPQAASYPPDE